MSEETTTPKEKTKEYAFTKSDIFKVSNFIAMIVLPAIGALYFTLAQIWGLPAAEQVIGSIAALDTFLGVILHRTSAKYDGTIDVVDMPDKTSYQLSLNYEPERISGRKDITFRVNPHPKK